MARLAALLTSASLVACSVVGIREAEEPKYQVIDRVGPMEIREYGPRLAAETEVRGDEMAARSIGFRRLAGYIFGDNTARAEIAMTAPVVQRGERLRMGAPVAERAGPPGTWLIRFFMPARYTMETLPDPGNPAVRVVIVPARTMAVLRFAGSTSPSAVAARQQELLGVLRGSAWEAAGEVQTWFYDPPWTLPPLRRTEVVVPVAHHGSVTK